MALNTHSFHGVIANLPATFQDDGRLDTGRLAELVDFVLASGVHGVSCLLSSGLFPYLSADERATVIDTVVRRVGGRAPVLAGVGGQTTAETVAHARRAHELGADALMVLPLSYWRMREVELMTHYKCVLQSLDATWGIYNAPQTTGVDISATMFRDIARYGDLRVTKDASGDVQRVLGIHETCGPEVVYLCGLMPLVLPSLYLGGHGACLAVACALPNECRQLYDLATAGELEQARTLYRRLMPLFQFFHANTNFRSVRLASELLGRPLGPMRPPLQNLEGPEIRDQMQRLLAQCGVRSPEVS